MEAGWYFSAPWDRILIRRGDPLGLRAAADHYGAMLAPGLSNATVDGRWISLLAWCLKWSHVAWRHADSRDLTQGDAARARYAWLRPLELMWVDRTLESGQTSGQLRGRRSIERWRKASRKPALFAMGDDRFHAYRQTGMYGAYRTVFRKVAGLTVGGDGWTLCDASMGLARRVNDSLPAAARLAEDAFEGRVQWKSWIGKEARFWLDKGWSASLVDVHRGWLPNADETLTDPLPLAERRILEKLLFNEASARRLTAQVLASTRRANSHAELCDHLAQSPLLRKRHGHTVLSGLPAFSRFADASMDVMRTLWDAIHRDDREPAPPIDKLLRSVALCDRLHAMRQTGAAWMNTPCARLMPFGPVATRLAHALQTAPTATAQLRVVTAHHWVHGGGRRWFREDAGRLLPLAPETGVVARNYGFRLRPLALLAAQCGVADMRSTIDAMTGKGDLAGETSFEDHADEG